MNKTKIEWCDYTWNPVTGCKNGCWYCYARKISMRFQKHFKPTFRPERLIQPIGSKGSKIFVCSMADLFGKWVPSKWIKEVISITKRCPQHIFQFLTKNPERYKDFIFPDNCWLGATDTGDYDRVYDIKSLPSKNKKFISFEPLLFEAWGSCFPSFYGIDWIIIGALTGNESKSFKPKGDWISTILYYAEKHDIPVFMKSNLEPIWKGKLRQEFPNNLIKDLAKET